jgi:SAM-dependent methyltransferase
MNDGEIEDAGRKRRGLLSNNAPETRRDREENRKPKRVDEAEMLPIPPADLLKIIGAHPADYLPVGQELFRIFRTYTGLKPAHRVLDIGCGCGRVAWHLTKFLTRGSYDGFDVVPDLVSWCRNNITPRYPEFRFEHVDVASFHYHEQGAIRAGQFRFPYADDSFHRVLLASVFTHMLEPDFRHYTTEIARTLRPGGTVMMSFFLLNDESRRSLYRPDTKPKFWHRRGRLMIKRRGDAESAVAYPEDMVRAVLHESGLELQQILFGSWCGREETVSYQDIVVAHKRRRPAREGVVEAIQDTALRLTGWLRR